MTGNIRRAFTLIELVVSASLMIAGLAIFGQLTTATGRTWSQTRQHNVAMEELSSQLDR
jgi:Tfp pilus assembly protein FimT